LHREHASGYRARLVGLTGMEARSDGLDGPAAASRWRPGATVDELLRAAEAMEAMAASFAGARRAEMHAAADELRDLAWRRGGPEPATRGRRFVRGPQPLAAPAQA